MLPDLYYNLLFSNFLASFALFKNFPLPMENICLDFLMILRVRKQLTPPLKLDILNYRYSLWSIALEYQREASSGDGVKG